MFIKFEGRILNVSQIQFIKKFDNITSFGTYICINIHFLSKETLQIEYKNKTDRENAYIKLEELLIK